MTSFKVKVCGITRSKDAVTAAELGVDMFGLIFYRQSPRFVTLKQAGEIVKAVPGTVLPVGVFVDEPVEKVMRTVERLRLVYVQLHGRFRPADIKALMQSGVRVIQAFGVESNADIEAAARSKADLVLLDNVRQGMCGGTGTQFDWNLKLPKSMKNIVLSGGVNAGNVAEGVARFRPLVVDVNSNIEVRPGKKSKKKLTAFMKECNRIRYGS